MDKIWVVDDPDELLRRRKTRRMEPQAPPPDEKSPATAYSWSVLFWGGGQFYNDQVVKGLSFFFLMVAFYAGAAAVVVTWSDIVRFLRERGISASALLLAAFTVLLSALIFWRLCCSNAYHGAAKTRKTRFPGVKNRVFPFLCSLLLPGWGQFLNGQPVKGSIYAGFSVVSSCALVIVPAVLLVWHDLEPSSARFLVESIFTIAVLFLPLIPFIWLIGSYDALTVSLEDLKKEPLWERIKAANNRRRTQGWVRGIFPQIKWTLVLVLFLVFFLVVIYNYFPRTFYASELASARSWLQAQGMTLLPDLLGRLFPAAIAGGI